MTQVFVERLRAALRLLLVAAVLASVAAAAASAAPPPVQGDRVAGRAYLDLIERLKQRGRQIAGDLRRAEAQSTQEVGTLQSDIEGCWQNKMQSAPSGYRTAVARDVDSTYVAVITTRLFQRGLGGVIASMAKAMAAVPTHDSQLLAAARFVKREHVLMLASGSLRLPPYCTLLEQLEATGWPPPKTAPQLAPARRMFKSFQVLLTDRTIMFRAQHHLERLGFPVDDVAEWVFISCPFCTS